MEKKFEFANYLNNRTKAQAQAQAQTSGEKIVMVDVYDIDPHPKNKYSLGNIEILAAQIETQGGIKDPLILKKRDNGKYYAISGQRRCIANKMLLEANAENITKFVPAIIRSYANEEEENFAIAAANAYRTKSLEDKELEIQLMIPLARKEYEEAKQSGKPMGRFRAFLGEKLGISSTVVQRIEKMKDLAPELREEINKGNLDITPASELTALPQDEQKKIYHEAKEKYGKVTGKAIKEVKKVKEPASISKEINYEQQNSSVALIDAADEKIENRKDNEESNFLDEDNLNSYEASNDPLNAKSIAESKVADACLHPRENTDDEFEKNSYKKAIQIEREHLEKRLKTLVQEQTETNSKYENLLLKERIKLVKNLILSINDALSK